MIPMVLCSCTLLVDRGRFEDGDGSTTSVTGATSGSGGGQAGSTASSTNSSSGSTGGTGGGGAMSRGWPDSATAFCTDGNAEAACADVSSPPQDGTSTTLTAPSYTYVDVNHQALRDDVTGLVWTTYAAANEALVDYEGAVSACQDVASSGLAGIEDWRLPTRLELTSLLDFGASSPMLTPELHYIDSIWTSTPSTLDAGEMYYVWFGGGTIGTESKSTTNLRAACVSGELSTSDFGLDRLTVTDPRTRLMWERNDDSGNELDWMGARGYCAQLATDSYAGFTNWRLPTNKEIATIVDDTKTALPLIRDGFGWAPGGAQHWTSTPMSSDPTKGWVFTNAGTSYTNVTSHPARARCVRSLDE